MKKEIKEWKAQNEELITEKRTTLGYVKTQEKETEEIKSKLEKLEKENRHMKRKVSPDTGSMNDDRIKDENEALIAQRNALSKQNESLLKDLDKKSKQLEKFIKENEGSVSRLTQSNKRFLDEQKEQDQKIDELEEKNERLLEDKNEIIFKQKDEIQALKDKLKEKSSVANKFKDLFSKKSAEEVKKPQTTDSEIQTDPKPEKPLEESPSQIGLGLRKYSKQMKGSFMNASNASIDSSVANTKELKEMIKKLRLLEKEKKESWEEKLELKEEYDNLSRMLDGKDDQLEEMRVEIERLAGKLWAAESKLYEVTS